MMTQLDVIETPTHGKHMLLHLFEITTSHSEREKQTLIYDESVIKRQDCFVSPKKAARKFNFSSPSTMSGKHFFPGLGRLANSSHWLAIHVSRSTPTSSFEKIFAMLRA